MAIFGDNVGVDISVGDLITTPHTLKHSGDDWYTEDLARPVSGTVLRISSDTGVIFLLERHTNKVYYVSQDEECRIVIDFQKV